MTRKTNTAGGGTYIKRPRNAAKYAKRGAALRARRELAELDTLRLVAEATSEGLSQDAVAAAIGASQASVSRALKRLSEQPQLLQVNVDEVIRRALVKEISRPAMVEALRRLQIPYVNPVKRPGSDWAKVVDALHQGLVERSEVQVLAQDAAKRLVLQVSDAMDLEDQPVPPEHVRKMLANTTERIMADL